MAEHDFHIYTNWEGGRDSSGKVSSDTFNHSVSIPEQLGGIGEGTNPDELLISAASSCITISLASTLERAHLPFEHLKIHSIGTASFENGYFKMKHILHQPIIIVNNEIEQQKMKRKITRLIEIADKHCMVSNSLRGNVDIQIKPSIEIK